MSALEMGFFAIPVLNMGIAKTFYGQVMDWAFEDRDPDFSYVIANGSMIGALEAASDRLKPSENGPLLYFRADSMESTLSRVSAAGGTIVERQSVDDGARGHTAKVVDPFGNAFGFWAPEL